MVNLSIIDNVIFRDEIPFSTIFICVMCFIYNVQGNLFQESL